MAEERLYRHIVDVLLSEHERSQSPSRPGQLPSRTVACAWGLYCQIHRTARAAVTLIDQGMGHEAIVLVRVMIEHTIMLHWIVEREEKGVDALEASQARQVRNWLDQAAETALTVPPDVAKVLTDSFEGIDEAAAVKAFKTVCEQVDSQDLYAVYGFQCQYVHPSITTSNAYRDPLGQLSLVPAGDGHPNNISIIAHCLIWAERDFDRLVPRRSRAEELEKLARSIDARPTLPPYHPIPPSKRRNTRKNRAKASKR